MPNDRFDEEIKKLLGNLEDQYDPDSWTLMSHKLDQANQDVDQDVDQDVEAFDASIRARLKGYEIPVSEQDWQKLKEDLNLKEERKEKIIVTKAIEIATILLLLLTITNFKSHISSTDIKTDPTYLADLSSKIVTDAILVHDKQLVMADHLLPIAKDDRTLRPNEVYTDDFSMQQSTSDGLVSFVTPPHPNELKARNKQDILVSIDKIPAIAIDIPNISSLSIRPLTVNISLPEAPFLDILVALDSDENPRDGWALGLPLSADINFVNSNFNVRYLRSQIKNNLSGKTFGVTLAYRKGALEVETGARYSAKRFAPGLITYKPASANSFLLDELDEVRFKQLQIPLIVKLSAVPHRNTSFYGIAGISTNVLLDMDYKISKSIQSNARPVTSSTGADFNLNNLPNGLAEGGDLNRNLYMTALVGFGIQHHISPTMSWYVQPQYQHTISTNINEVASEINTLSIELGLRFKL